MRPALEAFLDDRGLQLSDEKTTITHIKHGFEFLGQTFRKRAGTLHITRSDDSVTALLRKLGTIVRGHVHAPLPALVNQLNQALRGWGNYHRHVVAGDAFARVNLYVYRQLWRLLRRRHPGRSKKWLTRRYWDTTTGAYPPGGPSMEGSSGMTGNCHVPFHGGARGDSPQPYPVGAENKEYGQ